MCRNPKIASIELFESHKLENEILVYMPFMQTEEPQFVQCVYNKNCLWLVTNKLQIEKVAEHALCFVH